MSFPSLILGNEDNTRLSDSLPAVDEYEIAELAQRFGLPQRRSVYMQADPSMVAYRFRGTGDRRAEVVFVIQDPSSVIWVHNKQHYPSSLFRLPSGGIHWHERVEDALMREIAEETALLTRIERFLGVIEYFFYHEERIVHFASYVFHLYSEGGQPYTVKDEEITGFRAILPCQLLEISADLHNLIGDRRLWGQWRAVSHDLAYDTLVGERV
jgi:ADP-ribose pyrophosphatase YjhB (NUDIX family)